MSTSPPDQSGVSGVGNVIQRLAALHRTGETVPRDRSSFAWGPGEAVRWRWTEGDLVIWDGACTLHRALVDHHPAGCAAAPSTAIGLDRSPVRDRRFRSTSCVVCEQLRTTSTGHEVEGPTDYQCGPVMAPFRCRRWPRHRA